MIPLPSPADVFNADGDANAKSLYVMIYNAERAANTKDNAMLSRIVGYLLLDPLTGVRAQILKEVAYCHSQARLIPRDLNEAIYTLGKRYLDHYIRPFKGPTPPLLSQPSRRSFDQVQEAVKTDRVQTPQNHETAKKQALLRDGYRCVISGKVDLKSAADYEASNLGTPPKGYIITQCCHILPMSMSNFNGAKERADKLEYAANVWTVLKFFGYLSILDELKGAGIYRLENILTLAVEAHQLMDDLMLWFEEVPGKDNCYYVKSVGPATRALLQERGVEDEVTFVTQDEKNLPLPNPNYLRIHAVCCRVAHMSGAGEYLDKVLRDIEELPVLAADGTSGDILARALRLVALG